MARVLIVGHEQENCLTWVLAEYGAFQIISGTLYLALGIFAAANFSKFQWASNAMVLLGSTIFLDEIWMVHECFSEKFHFRKNILYLEAITALFLFLQIRKTLRIQASQITMIVITFLLVVGCLILTDIRFINFSVVEELGEAIIPIVGFLFIISQKRNWSFQQVLNRTAQSLSIVVVITIVFLYVRPKICPLVDSSSWRMFHESLF